MQEVCNSFAVFYNNDLYIVLHSLCIYRNCVKHYRWHHHRLKKDFQLLSSMSPSTSPLPFHLFSAYSAYSIIFRDLQCRLFWLVYIIYIVGFTCVVMGNRTMNSRVTISTSTTRLPRQHTKCILHVPFVQ